MEQFLHGRFADASHEIGPGVGVPAIVAVAGSGLVVLVRFAGRQEVAKAHREVLEAYLPVAVPVQVGEYHVRVAGSDVELGAQFAELVRPDSALAAAIALVKQILQVHVGHGGDRGARIAGLSGRGGGVVGPRVLSDAREERVAFRSGPRTGTTAAGGVAFGTSPLARQYTGGRERYIVVAMADGGNFLHIKKKKKPI